MESGNHLCHYSDVVSSLGDIVRRQRLWLLLVVPVLWIGGTRWSLRHEPLDRDISTYAVIGREMLTGRALYADLWDHKPPGIYLIFAGATALIGPGVPAVLLVNLVFSIAVMGGLMVAGRRIAGPPGAIAAGFLWAVVGGDLGLQANQPNVELPMNACVAWALSASLAGCSGSAEKRAWLTGGLTSCGLLLKSVVAAPLFFLAVVDAGSEWRRGGVKSALNFATRWICAVTFVLVPALAWCIYRAEFGPVWDAVVRYNLAYGKGDVFTNLLGLTKLGVYLPLSSLQLLGLLAVAGVAGFLKMSPPERRRIAAVLVGSAIAIAAPGRFYPHYFQLLLPPLVLAAAIGLVHALRHGGARKLAAVALLAAVAGLQLQSFLFLPADWSRQKYGEVFLDEVRFAKILEERVSPGEFFWQLGPQPGLYLLTGTVPASGVLCDYPLLPRSPVREQLAERIVADLTLHRPRFVAVQDRRGDRGVFGWIRDHYRVIENIDSVGHYRLWMLKEPAP